MLGGVSYTFVISSIYVRYYPSIYLTSFTCTRPSIYLSILDFNHSFILNMSHSPSPNSLIPSLQMTEYFLIFFISLCLLLTFYVGHCFLHEIFEIFETLCLNPLILSHLQSLITVSQKSQSLISFLLYFT